MTFLEQLNDHECQLNKIRKVAYCRVCPDFGDLWWDEVDIDEAMKNPGVLFETSVRRFAIAEIKNELRYFAGRTDVSATEFECEVGTLDALSVALEFCEMYLTSNLTLRDIACDRNVIRRISNTISESDQTK